MKYLPLILQLLIMLIALLWTIAAVNEFKAGDINAGLASMAVVIGTGVFQIIVIGTQVLRMLESRTTR